MHFIFAALWFSIYDIKYHLVRNRHLQFVFLPALPLFGTQQLMLGISNWLIYLILYQLSGARIGFGDVQLALPMGLYMAVQHQSLSSLLFFNFIAWVLAGSFVVLMGIFKDRDWSTRIAFAPFLFLAAGISLIIK